MLIRFSICSLKGNMRKIYLFTFLYLLSFSITVAQNSGNNIFSGIQVHTINLKFDQQNYWDSLSIYYNQGNEQLSKATTIVNGKEFKEVCVRCAKLFSYASIKWAYQLTIFLWS
jgi:spore coat protein CotH